MNGNVEYVTFCIEFLHYMQTKHWAPQQIKTLSLTGL